MTEDGRNHREEDHVLKGEGGRLPQTVLICQLADTRLQGDDRDVLGTINLTGKDLRRTLVHENTFRSSLPGRGRKEVPVIGRQGCGKRVTSRYGTRHDTWALQSLGTRMS